MSIRILKIKPVALTLMVLSFNSWGEQLAPILSRTEPWSARYTSQGLVGKHQLSGFIDGFIPIFGAPNQLWFMDGSFLAGQNNNYALSIGAGHRQLRSLGASEAILGAYLFADYQKNRSRTEAWLANPGIELLMNQYEARIQGYFSVSKRQKLYHYSMASEIPQSFLNESGQSNTLAGGRGHTYLDTPGALADEFGNGVEGEIGCYFPLLNGAWLRGGGYYFNYPSAKNITGVQANIELYLNKNASFIVQNNYDNQNKNKFSLGLRYSFGGPDHTQVNNLSNRFEEPIIRHQARQSYGLASPIRDTFIATGATQVVADNVWFFSRQGTNQGPINLNSCTAENPCLDLYQGVVSGINTVAPDASLWFATGTYAIPTTKSNGYVNLYNGQTLSGRTYNFSHVATGAARPQILGGLWWEGNGQVNDLQIINNNQIIPSLITRTGFDEVIAVGGTANMIVNNTAVTSTGTGVPETYAIYAGVDATINNSLVNALSTGEGNTYGIYGKNKAFVSLSTSTARSGGFAGSAYAVKGDNDAIVTSSVLNASGVGDVTLTGVYSEHNALVTDSSINTNGPGIQYGTYARNNSIVTRTQINLLNSLLNGYGIYAKNDAQVYQSAINLIALKSSSPSAGISAENNATVDASALYIAAADYTGEGVSGVSGNNIILTNSNLKVFAFIGKSTGVYAQNEVTVDNTLVNSTTGGDNTANGLAGIAMGVFSQNGDVNVTDSTVRVTGNGYGVFGVNTTTTNSSINLAANNGTSVGIYSLNQAKVSNSSEVNLTGAGSLYGVYAEGNAEVVSSTINTNGGLQVFGVMSNQANVLVIDSSVDVSGEGVAQYVAGVYANNILGQNVNAIVTNSNVNVTNTGGAGSATTGILAINSNAIVSGSTIKIEGNAANAYAVQGDTSITMNNSTVNASSSEVDGTSVLGLFGGDVNVTNSSITVTSADNGISGNGAIGIVMNTATLDAVIVDAQNTNSSPNSVAIGVYGALGAPGLVSFEGNASSVIVSGSNVAAIYAATVTNTNNSQCIENGVEGTCM